MDDLKELKDLICELKSAVAKKDSKETVIVPLLQKIGAELLTKYEIRLGNLTIEPLRVEPYLFQSDVYEDKFIHKDAGIYGAHQRNRFGKFYIHKGYSGVDIVLSDKDECAFSFLIKNSRIRVNGHTLYPIVKQYGVAKVLKENDIPLDYDKLILYRKEKPNNSIVFKTIRNGLMTVAERDDFSKAQQNEYNQLLIASFIELKEHTARDFGFMTGFGGEKAVVEYLKDYKRANPNTTLVELDRLRKKLYPNGSRTTFTKEFGE